MSGVRNPESETSDSTMGSIHIVRPASATGLNVDRAPPKSSLASMPNQSTNPVLLNYLSTKLANLKETRSKKQEFYDFKGPLKHTLVAPDNLSTASGVTSDTDLNTASETFLVDPASATNKQATGNKSEAKTTGTTTSSTSTSWDIQIPPGVRIDDAVAGLAAGKTMAEISEMRREVSNPEIKIVRPPKLSKQMKKDSRSSRKRGSSLKGVPEDEQEQSRTSKYEKTHFKYTEPSL